MKEFKAMKRMLSLFACIIAFSLLLAGCGESEAKKAMEKAVESANVLLKETPYDEGLKETLEKLLVAPRKQRMMMHTRRLQKPLILLQRNMKRALR